MNEHNSEFYMNITASSRRWVVRFTFRPLYPQGKSPWYTMDRRLRGPQSRSSNEYHHPSRYKPFTACSGSEF